jgi:hypothetical protein
MIGLWRFGRVGPGRCGLRDCSSRRLGINETVLCMNSRIAEDIVLILLYLSDFNIWSRVKSFSTSPLKSLLVKALPLSHALT